MSTTLADLEIRISSDDSAGATRLRFTLHSPSGAVKYNHSTVDGEIQLRTLLPKFREDLFSDLQYLDEGLLPGIGTALDDEEVQSELAKIGHELYEELFPQMLRTEYEYFRHRVSKIHLISSEPWIPWEIIKPHGQSFGEDDYLCCRFELTRWLAGKGGPAKSFGIGREANIVCVDASRVPGTKELDSRKEGDQLGRLAGAYETRLRTLEDATHRDVIACLQSAKAVIYHFIGHSRFDSSRPNESLFLLHGKRSLRPRDLSEETIKRQIREYQPLVFFNCCEAAQQAYSLSLLGGWVSKWIKSCGCGGFVGPQWDVKNDVAALFAESFYDSLQKGGTVAHATQQARLWVRQEVPESIGWLAYAAYVDPAATLKLKEAVDRGVERSEPEGRPPKKPPRVPKVEKPTEITWAIEPAEPVGIRPMLGIYRSLGKRRGFLLIFIIYALFALVGNVVYRVNVSSQSFNEKRPVAFQNYEEIARHASALEYHRIENVLGHCQITGETLKDFERYKVLPASTIARMEPLFFIVFDTDEAFLKALEEVLPVSDFLEYHAVVLRYVKGEREKYISREAYNFLLFFSRIAPGDSPLAAWVHSWMLREIDIFSDRRFYDSEKGFLREEGWLYFNWKSLYALFLVDPGLYFDRGLVRPMIIASIGLFFLISLQFLRIESSPLGIVNEKRLFLRGFRENFGRFVQGKGLIVFSLLVACALRFVQVKTEIGTQAGSVQYLGWISFERLVGDYLITYGTVSVGIFAFVLAFQLSCVGIDPDFERRSDLCGLAHFFEVVGACSLVLLITVVTISSQLVEYAGVAPSKQSVYIVFLGLMLFWCLVFFSSVIRLVQIYGRQLAHEKEAARSEQIEILSCRSRRELSLAERTKLEQLDAFLLNLKRSGVSGLLVAAAWHRSTFVLNVFLLLIIGANVLTLINLLGDFV